MDQAGPGDEFLELGHKWCIGNLPACKRGTNSATGHLDMVPYLPDFL